MKRQRKRRSFKFALIIAAISSLILIITMVYFIVNYINTNITVFTKESDEKLTDQSIQENDIEMPSWIETDLIDINEYSRPGIELKEVNAVVVHYTGNPGTTALQHRNYYNGLAESKDTSVSSHFVIGLEGEVILCVPLDEVAYASNDRNSDTISIEACHENESGKLNDKTYKSLIKVIAYLCDRYNLDEDGILRHYDVTGKKCPLYYVNYPLEWQQLKDDAISCKTSKNYN